MNSQESPNLVEQPSYGWRRYRPGFLQCCLTSKWVAAACCFLIATESFIATGLSGVTITSLEKQFYLRSFQVGGILTCYEVSSVVLALIVSYYGHVHKAKWLGFGAIALGFGCLVFAMPQWLSDRYSPTISQRSDLCQVNSTEDAGALTEEKCRSVEWYYIFIFILGQLLIGAGASPIYNLAISYVDENVSRKNSGMYLAILYAISAVGPALGFLLAGYFLTIWVDIEQPEGVNLSPDDSSWVGAWWLGFVFAGIVGLAASIPLLGFPNQLPDAKALQEERKVAKDFIPEEEKPRTLKLFLPALKSMLKNKVFLFTTIGITAEAFHINAATFFPKFIEFQYNVSSSDASLYMGGVAVPGAAVGILLGGYLIRRFKWACQECVRVNVLVGAISTLALFVFLIHCPNRDIVGMTTSSNRTGENSVKSCFTNNCTCNQNYIPVCTKEDQRTYFSPCYAGCTQQTIIGGEKAYANCSCLPGNLTVAYDGGCSVVCNSLAYFMTMIFLLVVVVFMNSIPAVTVTLRCVPQSQGSFALGVQMFILKLFAFIPAPIVFGALLDSVCILSLTDPCDDNSQRNCLEYRNDHLSYVFLGGMATCKAVAVTFYFLAWRYYKPPSSNTNENVEIPAIDRSEAT
ncbi:solute carrier organic anion transporter family member 4C1-like [Dendronephthya gigantea]|uniref:solute carrier organic anion transporter family member 4C1-like n=1 Tax=Dendronephthya gigantea TaxID=151771 RepID=UPI00106B280D|nr:solute carrier organic anion transporter family member 4C1-like [Dendronephthya gigantea]